MSDFIEYLYFYPICMTFFWISGSIIFFIRRELGQPKISDLPELENYPHVTVLLPCYNEEATIEDTLNALSKQKYPDFEVIAVNDGSSDKTGDILESLLEKYSWLRIIHLEHNSGKATSLNMGLLASKSEFLVCIDADTLLDSHAIFWIMYHFLSWPDVGAVTGNPRIRNRSSLLGRIQVGEFSAIVGMIKRCQRIIGKVFTVSGVIAGFRKSALVEVGMWDTDMLTEDIDISWKLQLNSWDIRYEPRAVCKTLMPETLKGLWKQRLRWAEGGLEVIIKNLGMLKPWKQCGLSILYFDYILSIFWIYSIALSCLFWLFTLLVNTSLNTKQTLSVITQVPGNILNISIIIICLLQFAVGIMLDSRYEKSTGRYYYWTVWYPLVYWLISVLTTIIAVPKVIFKKKTRFATWESPDRGITGE